MQAQLQKAISELHHIFGHNIALTPCRGKKAYEQGFNKLTYADMTPNYLARFPGPNIGIVCGQNSDHLCALDIDGDGNLEKFLEILPGARQWPMVVGKRGAKLFVRVKGIYPKTHFLFSVSGDWGEWRGDGSNSVAWGRHPVTDQPYRWMTANAPPLISFDIIQEALARLGVAKRAKATAKQAKSSLPTNKGESSPATCILHSTSCALYNKNAARDVVSRIKARDQMRAGVTRDCKRLLDLYCRLIEPRFYAAARHRNGFIVEAVPFLLRCVSPGVAGRLVLMFYDAHASLFKDTRERHEYETSAMISSVEHSYATELEDYESQMFSALRPSEQCVFRICRDLARRPKPHRPPLTFFLSCGELAARLQISDMAAHRLLGGFVEFGILLPLKKGRRWRTGERPTATTYRWMPVTEAENTA